MKLEMRNLRKKRRIYVLALTLPIILILGITLALGLHLAKPAQALWMNDSWAYRIKVPVTGHTFAETNVYFPVTIDTSDTTRFQADCGDLRFTDTSGKLLQYYIASGCSSASTVIHVNVPSFPAAPSDYYYYYGNPSAPDGFSSTDFTLGNFITVGSVGSEEKGTVPVAYWSFDDGNGTAAQDGTTNNNDGTLSNGPVWKTESDCLSAKCLYFDGSDDIVTVTNATPIDLDASAGLSAGFTFEAWIKPNGAGEGTGGQIFFKGTNTWLKVTNLSSGLLDLSASVDLGTTDATLTASAKVTNNQWTHIALSYTDDADDEITIWVNGVAVGTSTNGVGSLASDSNNLIIGGTTTNNFAGFIDEFKIYNTERSAAQMKADFTSRGGVKAASTSQGAGTQSALSTGLIGYWPLSENTGTSTADSSGNGNTGTLTNGPSWVAGKYGSGLQFDGADDVVDVGSASVLDDLPIMSVSAWINPASLGEGGLARIFEKQATVTTLGWLVQLNTSNQIIFRVDYSGTDLQQGTSNNVFSFSTWTHVLITWDGTSSASHAHIYINGVESTYSTTVDGTGSRASDAAQTLKIGNTNDGSRTFDGTIDEARVYNRILSPAEARQLYTFAPGPIGYWKFDEKTGTTAKDMSGNSHNGTLQATAGWGTGKFGSDVVLDNTSTSYVDMGNNDDLTTTLTLEAWVYRTGNGDDDPIIAKKVTPTSGAGYSLYQYSSGNGDDVCLDVQDATHSAYDLCTSATPYPLNTWAHVVATYDGTTAGTNIYINGVVNNAGGRSANTVTSATNANSLLIGKLASPVFSGSVDDVRIYNYARTPSQVIEDMNGGHPLGGSPIASQLIYWNMDEQATATIHNTGFGGSAYDGAANGPQWSTIFVPVCKVNGCLNFDTASDFVNGTDVSFTDSATALSFSFWINPSTLATGKSILSKYSSGQTSFLLATDGTNSDELKMCIASSTSDACTTNFYTTTNADLVNGTWSHITVVYDGTQVNANRIKIYKNGRLLTGTTTVTIPASMVSASSSKLKLGDTDDVGSIALLAYYDELKIYNTSLTSDQVALEANYGSSVAYSTGNDEPTQITGSAETVAIAYWPFEEGSGTLTSNKVGNTFNGTLNNSPTWSIPSSCKVGKCLSFASASSQDVSLAVPVSGIESVSFWAKPTSTTTNFLQLQASGAVAITATAGTISATGFTSPTIYVNGNVSSTITANVWQYITVTSATSVSGSAIKFGHVNATYYDGLLDEIKMYNYVRTKAQVNYDFNRGAPIGWWQFDDCQGNTAYDNSGNGNNAALTYGGGTYTQPGTCNSGTASDAWFGGAVGRFNGAIAIDATTDQIKIGNIALYNFERTDPFSTSIWFKTSSLQSTTLFSKQESSGNFRGWNVQIEGTGRVYFQFPNVYNTNILEARTPGSMAYADSNWHHVVTTYDGSVTFAGIHIYFDGKDQVLQQDFAGSPLTGTTTNSAPVYVGSRNGNDQKFAGLLDDARLYNYPLSASQVKTLYNGGFSVNFGPASGSP